MVVNTYKALVVDFDYTLVGDDMMVAPALEQAIKTLLKQGIFFSIATGRHYYGIIRKACKQLGLSAPQIVFGGAQIVDPSSDKTLWRQWIPYKEVIKIIQLLQKRKIIFFIEKGDATYSTHHELPFFYGGAVKLKPLNNLPKASVPKILVSANFNKMDLSQITELAKDIEKKFKDIHPIKIVVSSGYYGLDITSQKATKHLAVLKLSQILGIDPKQMAAVGDGYNDYPLLTACGLKIAMGTAPPELKAIADFVAPSIFENGLLFAINKFFLQKKI